MRASDADRKPGSSAPSVMRSRPMPCGRQRPRATGFRSSSRARASSLGATVRETACDCSPPPTPALRAAITAIPRAVASRSAATSRRTPDRSATVCRSGSLAARPPPTRTASPDRLGVQRVHRVGDLVGHAGQGSRRQVGGVVALLIPSTVIRSAPCQCGVARPEGAGTTTGRGRAQSGTAAGSPSGVNPTRRSTASALPAFAQNASSAYVRPSSRLVPRNRRKYARRRVRPVGAGVQPYECTRTEGQRSRTGGWCNPGRRAPPAGRPAWLRSAHPIPSNRGRSASRHRPKRESRAAAPLGTPNRSSSRSSQSSVSRLTSSVRQAFEGSVTWPAAPLSFHASQQATSPKSSSPASARRRSCGSRSNSHASFGAENVGSSPRPVIAGTSSAPGRSARSAHSEPAR